LGDDPRLPAFRDALKEYGTKRRHDIRSMPVGFPIAPFDASLTKRSEWLVSQVIAPVEKLLHALGEHNRPYFSEWPEEYRLGERPDFDEAHSRIEEILHHATALRASMDDQLLQKFAHTSEMRYDIVAALIDLLKAHFPEVMRSHGQYDHQLGQTVGTIPDYVRRAFLEITGSAEQLDAPIQQALAQPRKSERKSG
jgi:hypothetical protein